MAVTRLVKGLRRIFAITPLSALAFDTSFSIYPSRIIDLYLHLIHCFLAARLFLCSLALLYFITLGSQRLIAGIKRKSGIVISSMYIKGITPL